MLNEFFTFPGVGSKFIHTKYNFCRYYRCCGKIFYSVQHLREHEIIHSGFPVVCEHCGKDYSNIANYYRHKREKHPPASQEVQTDISSTDGKFLCIKCGEQFEHRDASPAFYHPLICPNHNV